MEDIRIFDQSKKDLESIGVPDALNAAIRIFKAYAVPNRHYHGLVHHLRKMFEAVKLLTFLTEWEALALRLLILYHDVWYEVGMVGKNERLSVKWALEDIDRIPQPHSEQIKWLRRLLEQGILATITHSLDDVDEEFHTLVSLLLDIDLLGVGESRASFKQDTELLWLEQKELPGADRKKFDRGTSCWAKMFLGRGHVFHHPWFADTEREDQAKRNLRSLVLS